MIAKDVDRDLAVLSVPGLPGKPLKLFKGEDMYVGETVYAVGNPEGQEGTFSSGMTSNFQMTKDPLIFHVQFTAPVSPGSSGGPLVNSKGEVIGVIDTQLTAGQNLNFAVAAAHLQSLLEGREINGYLDNNMTPPDEEVKITPDGAEGGRPGGWEKKVSLDGALGVRRPRGDSIERLRADDAGPP